MTGWDEGIVIFKGIRGGNILGVNNVGVAMFNSCINIVGLLISGKVMS